MMSFYFQAKDLTQEQHWCEQAAAKEKSPHFPLSQSDSKHRQIHGAIVANCTAVKQLATSLSLS